ncbi:hypothetical protein M422DRAFT_261634 [Sphaerobolus stellatus SS14]|uniref:Glutathione transferase n=1 Tax=Sphaerobolus stellatus (strain SS14) TaxID=990650 RepID=A0A0C9V2Y8_SPHS4|nr:hypothetical protein M422DRAFT_261634 [Sphaerobolus stellatus SS14]
MTPKVTLFGHVNLQAPNPPKIAILLEALGVEYEIVNKELGDGPNGIKGEDFLKINPNGRLPALIDHTNDDFAVWESGAILLYVAERFDPSGKFIGRTLKERAEVWEWLIFQLSGLGPMQGQYFWFMKYHPVKNLDQSVSDRYKNEVHRLYGVYEKQLEKHDWVALDRFTVADMANYPWLRTASYAGFDLTKFPKLEAYIARLGALPSIKKVYDKAQAPAQQ